MFRKTKKTNEPEIPEVEGLWGTILLRLDKKIDWTYEYRFGLLDVPTFIPIARRNEDLSPWKPERTSTSKLSLTAKVGWIEIFDSVTRNPEEDPGTESTTLPDYKGQPCLIEVGEVSSSKVDNTHAIGAGDSNAWGLEISIFQTSEEMEKLLSLTALTEHADHVYIWFGIEQVPTDRKCSIPELMKQFAVNHMKIRTEVPNVETEVQPETW